MGERQIPAVIERVQGQFADWRAHKQPRERIPERLWQGAVDAARRHGVHAVSRALRLEHSRLRQRVETAAGGGSDAAAFVELGSALSAERVGCIVELEKGNGARMRICVRDGASVDWSRMKEAFLGA
jgi:hypothetical protein